ncbi:MAG: response regulator [Oligoflexus sp.]
MAHEKKRCLLIDDNIEFASMLETALKNQYEVESVADAFTAHQLISNQKFDIILCDIQMPFMGGIELASQLRKKMVPTPVIFITGDANPEVTQKAFEVGAANILQKPFDLKDIFSKMEVAIRITTKQEAEQSTNHELGYIYNLLKTHYYDIQDILYQIQYYRVPLSVVKEELDKKERMGRCHLDDPENIKFLGGNAA